MAKLERIREVVSGNPGAEYFHDRERQGWVLAAVEWAKPVEGEGEVVRREVPYGLRVADDCLHLEPHPGEERALTRLLELLIDDGLSLAQVSEAMNRQGFRTREGGRWSPRQVFELLPRLVEVSPEILAGEAWPPRR